MQPTDAINVVTRATEISWESGILAMLMLVLLSLVVFHYRAMWSYIQRMSSDAQDVIDDNTLAWLQVARAAATRPCLHDSDTDMMRKTDLEPKDFGDNEKHVRRVLDRKAKRAAANDPKS